MAAHPLDHAVSVDNSFESFQLRQRKGELITPRLDEANRRRQLAGLLPRGVEIVSGSGESKERGLIHG